MRLTTNRDGMLVQAEIINKYISKSTPFGVEGNRETRPVQSEMTMIASSSCADTAASSGQELSGSQAIGQCWTAGGLKASCLIQAALPPP